MSVTVLGDALRAIYDAHGTLTPEAVVDAARDSSSPLHSRFEWDDGVAGEAYRRVQAAGLIRSVKITVLKDGVPTPTRVRAFVNLNDPEDETRGNYHPQEVVAQNPMLTALALRDMERRWRELKRSFEEHAEFWDMVRRDADTA